MRLSKENLEIHKGLLEIRYPFFISEGSYNKIKSSICSNPITLNHYEYSDSDGFSSVLDKVFLEKYDAKIVTTEKAINHGEVFNDLEDILDLKDMIVVESENDNGEIIRQTPLSRTVERACILNCQYDNIIDCSQKEFGYYQEEVSRFFILQPFYCRGKDGKPILVNVSMELFESKIAILTFRIPVYNQCIDVFPLNDMGKLFTSIIVPKELSGEIADREYQQGTMGDNDIDELFHMYLNALNKENKLLLLMRSIQHIIAVDYNFKDINEVNKYENDNLLILFESTGGCISLIKRTEGVSFKIHYEIEELDNFYSMLHNTTLIDRALTIIVLEYCNSMIVFWRETTIAKKDMKVAGDIMLDNIIVKNTIIEMKDHGGEVATLLLKEMSGKMPFYYRKELMEEKISNLETIIALDREEIAKTRQLLFSCLSLVLTLIIGLPLIRQTVLIIFDTVGYVADNSIVSHYSCILWLVLLLIICIIFFGGKISILIKRIIIKKHLNR